MRRFVLNYHNLSPPVRRTSCCGVDSFGSMPYRTRPYRARTTPQPLVLVPLAEATNKGGGDRLCPVDRQNLHNYILVEILLKKVRHRKCDLWGPVDRPNLHNYKLIENLQKMSCIKSVTLWVQSQTFMTIINRNFAQKSATQEV